MAVLRVTYGKADDDLPLEWGEDARSESVTIGASPAFGTLRADGDDNVVTLYPEANCLVVMSKSESEAAPPVGTRRFLPAEKEKQYRVRSGVRVVVIQA